MFEDHLPHMSQEKSDQFKHGDGEIRPKFHGIFRPEMSCQAFHGAKDVGVGLVESIHGIPAKVKDSIFDRCQRGNVLFHLSFPREGAHGVIAVFLRGYHGARRAEVNA
jgi:hypothetical protein